MLIGPEGTGETVASTGAMPDYLGQYENHIDDKGRLSLPAAFRKVAEGQRFVLLQIERPCLTLLTAEAWSKGVRQRLLELRRAGLDEQEFVRDIASQATEVVPDKQGRFMIPSYLKELASLESRVLVVGMIDRIELWDPPAFEGRRSGGSEEASAELAAFKSKLFG